MDDNLSTSTGRQFPSHRSWFASRTKSVLLRKRS